MSIVGITISREQLCEIIETWLNAHVLRDPQTVTSLDFDGETVSIGLVVGAGAGADL
jgi:hypothetical protein